MNVYLAETVFNKSRTNLLTEKNYYEREVEKLERLLMITRSELFQFYLMCDELESYLFMLAKYVLDGNLDEAKSLAGSVMKSFWEKKNEKEI